MFTTRRVLLLVIALLIVALIAIPASDPADERPALTVRSAARGGARGLHDVLERLGFRVEQQLLPMRAGLDSLAVYLVLDPPMGLTTAEIHALLQSVRAGASLLTIPSSAGALADSLAVAYEQVPVVRAGQSAGRQALDVNSPVLARRWRRGVLRRHVHPLDSVTRYTPPAGAVLFDSVRTARGWEPALVGFPLGKGRVVVAAEHDLFANFVLRADDAAVQVIRLLEWLQAGNAQRPLVFDEYHQGFGTHANTRAVTVRALTRTGAGRTVLQVALAGLLLLLALGVRPLKPKPATSIERRSALEHVSALARAYATVRANARATGLLVRGLRRRHAALRGARNEAAWLHALADAKPELANDVRLLAATMEGADPGANGATVTTAILRIERAITS